MSAGEGTHLLRGDIVDAQLLAVAHEAEQFAVAAPHGRGFGAGIAGEAGLRAVGEIVAGRDDRRRRDRTRTPSGGCPATRRSDSHCPWYAVTRAAGPPSRAAGGEHFAVRGEGDFAAVRRQRQVAELVVEREVSDFGGAGSAAARDLDGRCLAAGDIQLPDAEVALEDDGLAVVGDARPQDAAVVELRHLLRGAPRFDRSSPRGSPRRPDRSCSRRACRRRSTSATGI